MQQFPGHSLLPPPTLLLAAPVGVSSELRNELHGRLWAHSAPVLRQLGPGHTLGPWASRVDLLRAAELIHSTECGGVSSGSTEWGAREKALRKGYLYLCSTNFSHWYTGEMPGVGQDW